ncbi:hypothetical protein OTAKU_00200 [Serratia phage vB_SmaM-Otaku]|uniref:Spanin n=1 Tax=Serratia phage vB_SmaM-Otaku TaxID=2932867 RepID=A0AAE9HDE8_9CAUD|nr:hypothetical protein PF631_gp20 [Serratia phage vB_SmaM-Otaku]UPU16009.1 hypothetical protein OTAKU_00200 [Serratia phage vB_SmaM-Otaku]
MIRTYLLVASSALLVAYGYGAWQHHVGWRDGRAELVAQQADEDSAELAKKMQQQQKDDTKAAAADADGKAKTVTITNEVIRYVKTPGRTVCNFPDDRVRIKADAVANANRIAGYDDASVPAAGAK